MCAMGGKRLFADVWLSDFFLKLSNARIGNGLNHPVLVVLYMIKHFEQMGQVQYSCDQLQRN